MLPALKTSFWKVMSPSWCCQKRSKETPPFAFESVPVPTHYWLNEIMLRIRNQDEDENEDDAKWWCHQNFLTAPFQNQKPQTRCTWGCKLLVPGLKHREKTIVYAFGGLCHPTDVLINLPRPYPNPWVRIQPPLLPSGIPTRPHRLNTQVLFHPFI